MAHIRPDNPPLILPGEVLRTFKALKNLPDSYYVWHHLAPWQQDAPDFLMITKEGRALLIKVSPATKATSSIQLLLLDEPLNPLGSHEKVVLETFIKSLGISEDLFLETLVVFPNIPTKQVHESRSSRQIGDPQWVGREILQPESADLWASFFNEKPIDYLSLEKIRQKFSPEIVVPEELTVRQGDKRRIEAGLTDFLLDYRQETAVKNDLELDTEGKNLEKDFRVNIINGVAGSGKTLILIYRLRLLFHLYPDKQFLVLTHNRPLSHDLKSRFNRLEGQLPDNIEWRTFSGWCFAHWPAELHWKQPISAQMREKIIRQVWNTFFKNTSISEHMLTSEIDWIKDQLPLTESTYLELDRRKRGFGLSGELRQRMWNAYSEYQKILIQTESLDWGDIPQLFWNFIEEGITSVPQYDFVLIDEAQFFAPIWIGLIQKALKTHNSHLFIVADPTQGFLGRKGTWKSLGIEARGRTHQLRRSYRTTREILQFATMFYRSRLPDEKDEDILPPEIFNMPPGTVPIIIPLDSPQDEIARVANEVTACIKSGSQKKDILLLHANGRGVNALIDAINHRLGRSAAFDPKENYPGDYIRVTTINAGAGLESPIVFLVGLRELFEEEQSLRLSDEEREEIIRDNTKKIYMAATRAGQRLIFTYVGNIPNDLANLPRLS